MLHFPERLYNFLGEISFKDMLINIPHIFVNYGTDIGHLWYIYMALGIYLYIPIISLINSKKIIVLN